MGGRKPPRELRAARRPQPYRGPPVTVHDVRKYGVTELLVYCNDLVCNHCGRLSLAPFPDDLVLVTLDPRFRCTKCGRKGGNSQPDWTPHTMSGETMLGWQWALMKERSSR
jgi:hypothetical protein